jgi:radical SAM superfamily enzyme YgiQ (UPF0313 family)
MNPVSRREARSDTAPLCLKDGGALPLICLIQPPLTQLNTPYPSPYYLKSFLDSKGYRPVALDHSIGLFECIFCRSGLERIFADAEKAYQDRAWSNPVSSHSPDLNNKEAVYYIERFLSEKGRWLASIDRLTAFLRGQDREWGHVLALANGILPGGPRFDACVASLNGEVLPETAPLLAGKLLADLADFITFTLDPSFSLIRYIANPGVSLSAAFRDFSLVKKGLNGYILRSFYRPFLKEEWNRLEGKVGASFRNGTSVILGLTIPFPGCLAGALACAESAKKRFGQDIVTIAGGGYVNTELRFLEDERVFDYFDYLSFDRGYGSWEAILEYLDFPVQAAGSQSALGQDVTQETGEPVLYKTMYRSRKNGKIIRAPDIAPPGNGAACSGGNNEKVCRRFQKTDQEGAAAVFPDYRDVDFSRYLYPVDDENPMHRLWSDGHWLKAYLAHGCYWHSCAFCDVTLDYIRGFRPVNPEALFRHLKDQADKTGIRGIHLVDEAAPAASLLRLAELNRDAGLPLAFWGNIRFEGAFTPDRAAILASGGLVGVSAGIEVATERGFKRIGKGIGLREVVHACAAFKEAGILTHAYLIYGYWDEDTQELIDATEILRQLFAEKLVDSAFWHKFVLTRHSRLYAEWEQGQHQGLVLKKDGEKNLAGGEPIFAYNDLCFEGEEKFDRFTEPLDRLLASWMAGDVRGPDSLEEAFPFKVPEPSVPPGLVEGLVDEYARNRDKSRAAKPRRLRAPASPLTLPENPEKTGTGINAGQIGTPRVLFLGSRPLVSNNPERTVLFWRWRLEDHKIKPRIIERSGCKKNKEKKDGETGFPQTDLPAKARKLAALLEKASHGSGFPSVDFYRKLEQILGNAGAKGAWKVLRNNGLAEY